MRVTNVVNSVMSYWRAEFGSEVPTIYPGMQEDASRWPVWVELAMPVLTERNGRERGLQQMECVLDVHCFVERTIDLSRARRLVDLSRELTSGRVVPVRDFELSALPAVGYVRFGVAVVRDLTRVERGLSGRPLRHFLVSVSGLAQMSEG